MSGLGIKNFTKQQDQNIIQVYLSGKPANEIAREMKVFPQRITNCLRRNNIKIRIFYPGAKGERNANWKGGRRILKGYVHLLMPDHPFCRKDGYIAEHRYIMEQKIGRYLLPEEVVNHIDRNRINNNPNNLELFANNREHMRHHLTDFQRNDIGQFTRILS